MKYLAIAATGAAVFVSGCATKVATAPCDPCIAAKSTASVRPPPAVEDFKPYVLVAQAAPTPAAAPTQRHRYLHIAHRDNQTYLSDADGRYYHIGRDAGEHVYPAYYDPMTRQNYPLYYDRSRDRYYRVLRHDDGYYMNFVDDNSGTYYRCDRQSDFGRYAPARDECPVISDGYSTFTYYDQPDYYRARNRSDKHWRNDDWIAAVPILIGVYFVLNENNDSGSGWYYGYQGHDHSSRSAYGQDNRRAPMYVVQDGRRSTRYVTVTPPPEATVPRNQWAHFAKAAADHRSASQGWGNANRQTAQVPVARHDGQPDARREPRQAPAHAVIANGTAMRHEPVPVRQDSHTRQASNARDLRSQHRPAATAPRHTQTAAIDRTGAKLQNHRQPAAYGARNTRQATAHRQLPAPHQNAYGDRHAMATPHRNSGGMDRPSQFRAAQGHTNGPARPANDGRAHVAQAQHDNDVSQRRAAPAHGGFQPRQFHVAPQPERHGGGQAHDAGGRQGGTPSHERKGNPGRASQPRENERR